MGIISDQTVMGCFKIHVCAIYFGIFFLVTVIETAAPENSLHIYSLHITSDIKFRLATTLVTSRVVNRNHKAREAVFEVILPREAFISNFTLEIGGKIFAGIVKEKNISQKQCEVAERRGQTAAHVQKQKSRGTNKFKIEVNVAASTKVTFNLTYQEVLHRRLGVYRHRVYINPGQPVEDLKVDMAIRESREITLLRVLPLKKSNDLTDSDLKGTNNLATVSRPTSHTAYIRYQPSIKQQRAISSQRILGSYVVEYDIQRKADAGDILVVNGYFVHFFAPKIEKPISKDILFIIDTSSSMALGKMRQLKEAMKSILGELRVGDRFNIVEFNTFTRFMRRHELIPVSEENIKEAHQFVSSIYSTGATNINLALQDGLKFLNSYAEPNRTFLVFLTDGQASTGLTGRDAILETARKQNPVQIAIFSLAFGNDADWATVKKLAVQNNGVGRRIYEGTDAALQISGFYKEISTPVLTGVKFRYLGHSVDPSSLTSLDFRNYFNGSEVAVVGKLASDDVRVLSLAVSGVGEDGNINLQLTADVDQLNPDDIRQSLNTNDFHMITEKTWAYLTIKELLLKSDGEVDANESKILKKRALKLSLMYNFVTPLTSMVVALPGDGHHLHQQLQDEEDSEVSDRGGWNSRGGRDPHFMVETARLDNPLCFDFNGKTGIWYYVIRDPVSDIALRMKLKPGRTNHFGGKRVYIIEMSLMSNGMSLLATLRNVTINGKRFTWLADIFMRVPGAIVISQHNALLLRISFKSGFSIVIIKHLPKKNNPDGEQFLNFELNREGKLSRKTGGLLGQFIHKKIIMKRPRRHNNTIVTELFLKTRQGTEHGMAEMRIRQDPVAQRAVHCWQLKSGRGLFYLGHKNNLLKDIDDTRLDDE